MGGTGGIVSLNAARRVFIGKLGGPGCPGSTSGCNRRLWAVRRGPNCYSGPRMFGDSALDSPKETRWLALLEKAESSQNPQWGLLVAKNLREDSNVPSGRAQPFRDYLQAQPEAQSPDEAVRLLRSAVDELRRNGPTFVSDANSACRLSEPPFGQVARAVDIKSFGEHNLGLSARALRKASFRSHVAERVRGGYVSASVLKGNVGSPNGVWATDAQEIVGDSADPLDAHEVRDMLGLDDMGRFGRAEHVVFFSYGSGQIPDGAAYRPTVLDAAVSPMAAAWFPSDASTQEMGFTQDLATGQPTCPEIIHRPFPANEISALDASEALSTDPSTNYRTVRLGAGP